MTDGGGRRRGDPAPVDQAPPGSTRTGAGRQLDLELVRDRAPRRNASAVERTIRALRDADRLEPVDAALVAAARTLARALDQAGTPYTAATVARVHLEAVRLLVGRPAPEPDELDEFLRSLSRPAVGDSSNP